MPLLKFSRREWSLLLFPCALLLLPQLDKLRALDASRLAMALNPVGRANERKRMQTCRYHLMVHTLGLMQYQQDYDGRFPDNMSSSSNWVTAMAPYVYEYQLHCPTDSFSVKMIPSYWMNANLSDKNGRGIPTSAVTHPAQTFVFGDWDATSAKSPFTLDQKGWNSTAPYAERHLFGANYAFVDGHVKWFSSDDIRALQLNLPQHLPYSWKLER